jgi:hypothetical protein
MADHEHSPARHQTRPGTGVYHEWCSCGARRIVTFRGSGELVARRTSTAWEAPPKRVPDVIELELVAMRLYDLASDIRDRLRIGREDELLLFEATTYSRVADWIMASVDAVGRKKGGE